MAHCPTKIPGQVTFFVYHLAAPLRTRYTNKFEPDSPAAESSVFFSIRDLELRKIHFDVDFPVGEIDFLDPSLKQEGVLKADGVVELLSHTLGEVRLRGHLKAVVATPCDRCLEPATFTIDSDFDLYYRPADTGPGGEEVEIDDGEAQIGFYEGDGILLEDVLREYVLLALPMQVTCRQDCKGICPICGQNRNEVPCDCRANLSDGRWAALKNLKNL